MRKINILIIAVMLLSIVGTSVLVILSPDTVPVHYNAFGEPDRFGSKYEAFIWPIICILLGSTALITIRVQKKKRIHKNENLLLYTCLCTLLLFAGLGFCFTVKGMVYDPAKVSEDRIDPAKICGLGIGLLLILLGNIMPKARRNSLFGLRTKWSLSGDAVWQKSQRFGGIAAVILGTVMVILSAFLKGPLGLILLTVLLIPWVIACTAATYYYYKKEINPE